MKKYLASVICAAFAGMVLVSAPAFAQQKTVKQCEDEWKKDKAGNQAKKITEKAYVATCRGDAAAKPAAAKPADTKPADAKPAEPKTTAAPAPAPTAAPAPKPVAAAPAAAKPAAAPSTGGKAGEVTRIKACGADWKADKAAGKVPAGMKWPQYWSDCDKRKKAAGL
jgi:hypothetical protein